MSVACLPRAPQHLPLPTPVHRQEYPTPECLILCWRPRTKDDNTNLIMVLEMFREVSFFQSISSTKMTSFYQFTPQIGFSISVCPATLIPAIDNPSAFFRLHVLCHEFVPMSLAISFSPHVSQPWGLRGNLDHDPSHAHVLWSFLFQGVSTYLVCSFRRCSSHHSPSPREH
jgi:hypothetical protein